MGWLSGWSNRREITVSNTNIDSNLTHFPLLLTLGTSVGTGNDDVSAIFDELGSDANRKKIAVTKSDGTTQIYVEIVYWDDATETAILFVSKSDLTLSSSGTTTLCLYYDSSQSDNTIYVGDIGSTPGEAVWDSNFIYVHHGATASPVDSTSNDNDGTGSGNTTIAGPIGTAMDFDGTGYVDTPWPSSPGLSNGDGHTIEFWIDPDATNKVPVSAWNDIDNFGLFIDNRWYSGNSSSWTNHASGMTTAGWQQVAMAHPAGSGAMQTWRNGASVAEAGSYSTTFRAPVNPIRYGGDCRNQSSDFAGAICEVRLSDIQRSDAYMKANYHSTNDNLVSWGSEEVSGYANTVNTVSNIAKINTVSAGSIAKVNTV